MFKSSIQVIWLHSVWSQLQLPTAHNNSTITKELHRLKTLRISNHLTTAVPLKATPSHQEQIFFLRPTLFFERINSNSGTGSEPSIVSLSRSNDPN